MTLCFLQPASARVKIAELAERLIYGDPKTRLSAVDEFNRMSPEDQQKLVPDFMVAMSDEDPNSRKIASRILKAMGVKYQTQIPDIRKDAAKELPPKTAEDRWAAEKKMKQDETPDKWSDLKKMREEERGAYDGLKGELEAEKKGAWLDASELTLDTADRTSPLASVRTSLKDPDPWVRIQAARRIGTLRPAPVEAIPELLEMLGENMPELRRAGAAALGSFGPLAVEALPHLNSALSDPDASVRQIAADALQQIRQKQ